MKKFFPALLFLSIICLLLAHPLGFAFARAGGGESFGGSLGGGSFGGGGFGGGSGFFFLPLFFGGGAGGSVWIFICIILCFILPVILRRYGPRMGSTSNWGYRSMGTMQYGEADLSQITENDPGFSKERFVDKVQTAFFAIQRAWGERNLAEVRGYMTDAMYQRFNTQIQSMIQSGLTNHLEQIAIGSVTLVRAGKEGAYQTITAAIWASMIDYTTDQNNKITKGNKYQANEFTEYWTFIRSNSAKTKESDALLTKTCPNCGAPLEISEAGKCNYCGAYVISGDFDWVLSDISQQLV